MSKIMVVEDDASLREIYSIRITAEGYDVVSAGDGEEALAVAVREKPTLILSDVMMPKISGFDMLDILRSTPETASIKVIMMTALSADDQRQRGERLGADRYLVKSQVGIEDVINTIHEVLGDKQTTSDPTGPAPSSFAVSQNAFQASPDSSAESANPQPAGALTSEQLTPEQPQSAVEPQPADSSQPTTPQEAQTESPTPEEQINHEQPADQPNPAQ